MHPYPAHLVQRLPLKNGTVITVRPIRPDDAGIEQAFVRKLSNESRYNRFMDAVRELSPRMLSHFTQVDYDRHLALIAVVGHDDGEIQVAVARYVVNDDRQRGEFAIAVADEWQRMGLGTLLMQALMTAARAAGMRVMFGDVLASNHKMLRLMAKMGFSVKVSEQDAHVMRVEINLQETFPA